MWFVILNDSKYNEYQCLRLSTPVLIIQRTPFENVTLA